MKYAITKEGDQIVEEDIQKIIDACAGEDFKSLVLYGAFGRGEGCVLNGKPRNDYDLLLVGGSKELEDKITNIATGCVNEVWRIDGWNRKNVCTQKRYEVKYGSQLLAGEPLDLPDWEAYEIPFEDAMESLGNRAVSLILGKYEMMKDEPDWRKCIEQIAKGIIAVGDAVLIRRGEFHPKYTVRSHMLIADEIGDLYRLAVSIKLLNHPEFTTDEIWELWRQARGAMRKFMAEQNVITPKAKILFSITERHDREMLKDLLEELEVEERWL